MLQGGHRQLVPETPVWSGSIQAEAPPLEQEVDDYKEVHHKEGGVVEGGAESMQKTDDHVLLPEVVPAGNLVLIEHHSGDEQYANGAGEEGDHVEVMPKAQFSLKTATFTFFSFVLQQLFRFLVETMFELSKKCHFSLKIIQKKMSWKCSYCKNE